MLIQFACVSTPLFAGVINDQTPCVSVCVSVSWAPSLTCFLYTFKSRYRIPHSRCTFTDPAQQTIDPNDRLKIA